MLETRLSLATSERIEMAESVENLVAIALDSCLAIEEARYSDDSTAKPISRKKKTTRKQCHGKSTESTVDAIAIIDANYLGLLKGLPHNYIEHK